MVTRFTRLWLLAALAAGVLAGPAPLAAQATGRITGVVTGPEGQPLEGANVLVVGTGRGTLADAQGRYLIAAVPVGARQVRASLLGYADVTQAVTVNAGATVTANFSLAQQAISLQEIVAVAYGTQKKTTLTGAVASVSPAELTKRPVVNVSQALQGTTPGLTIVDRGGRPGAANNMPFIRGRGTLNSTTPLILIDGIQDDWNSVDANDIESVSVLKDAASTAMYGSRAANGVVLITTKRGARNAGSVKWSYDGYYGRTSVERFPQMLEGETYYRLVNTAYTNAGQPAKYSEDYIQKAAQARAGQLSPDEALKYPWTRWLDVLWHPAPIRDQTLSARGGSQLASFALSFNDYRQQGNTYNYDAGRRSVRLNTDFHPIEKLTAGVDLNLRRTRRMQPNNNPLWNMFHDTPPTTMAQYPDGTYGWSPNGNNPLAFTKEWGQNVEAITHGVVTAKADYSFLPGLTLRTQAAYQGDNYSATNWANRLVFYDYFNPTQIKKQVSNNTLDETRRNEAETYARATLDFSRLMGNHSLSAMGGFEQTYHTYQQVTERRQNFYNNDLHQINAGDASTQTTGGFGYDWGLRSTFGRVNYNYAGKYLLEANARYDGSSKFSPKNRYGFFPSLSGGWRISQEPFFKGIKGVDELKLRGSWGRMGNQDLGGNEGDFYPYWALISTGSSYVFNQALVQGASKNDLANQDIRWETTEMTDLGLDASFLRGRLSVSSDVYVKNTSNILRRLPIASVIGLGAPVQNKLKVQNKGIEFTTTWRDRAKGVDYSVNLNVAKNANKVVDLAGSGPYVDGIWLTKEGEALGTMYGYKTEGLFQSADEVKNHAYQSPNTRAGSIRYVDQNNDGKIDSADRVPIGNDMPKLTYGSQWTASWKNLDVSTFFQGVWSVNYWAQGALVEGPYWENFTSTIWADYWTPQNPNGHMPNPVIFTSHDQANSDYWVYDVSYVKLKNAQIGYTLPARLSHTLRSERLRVYLSGQNLLTWQKDKNMVLDPENNSGRGNDYPALRTLTFGVNVSY